MSEPAESPVSDQTPGDICPPCSLFPGVLDSTRFLWEYGGLPRDLIRTMKYRPSVLLAHRCGKILGDSLAELFGPNSWDIIVPVASSRASLRRRRFNPCAVMAHEVAKTLGSAAPVKTLLRHSSHRRPQASLSHEERLTGLRHLFDCRKLPPSVKRVLLVEDVITTGATTAAAAFTLKKAGATSVDVLALARSTVWSRFRGRLDRVFPPDDVR